MEQGSAPGAPVPQESLLGSVDADHLTLLREAGTRRSFGRGDMVVSQGERAETLHLVLRGRFGVRVDGRPVAEIVRGELIGEIAFLTCGRRTADVVAARDGETVAIERPVFDALLQAHPDLSRAVLSWMAQRLGRATARLPRQEARAAQMLCLVAAGDRVLPPAFLDGLRSALGPEARFMTARDFPTGADDEALSHAILAEEGRADLTVLLPDADDAFGRAAVRQTDGLVTVGSLAAPVPPSGLEAYGAGFHDPAHRRLILLREDAARPITGSAPWLDARDVGLHHHVALDAASDFARLARFLR
ncbi:MAG: cyclic nucleotide-binding domain-containing protein, partial [Jannaschia sp.]